MIITVYSDSGHAWAKVKKQFLSKLGIDKDISHYSYQRGDYAYLEEDSDLTKLCIALDANAIEYAFDEKHAYERPSKIRSYQSYKVEA
jgi:hypothetical protein